MPQPFDYTLNIPNPSQRLMNAVSIGRGITDLRTAQAKQQSAEMSGVAAQQMQADLSQLSQNPTPAAVAKMMAKYPQLSEEFKRTYDVLSEEQRNSRVGQASEVYAALQAGEPDVAQQLLEQQAEAYKNSGLEKESKTLSDLARLVELSPETAKTSTGLFLASAMGADKFTETFTKLEADRRATQLEDADLTEKQAKAYKAAVDADFAESQAAADLQKKGWDIYKIQEDAKVAKENTKIAALNAELRRQQLAVDKAKDSTQRQQNELRRQEMELKLEEMKRKRDEAVNGKVAEVESARGNVDNMLNTLDRVMQTPLSVIENATGPVDQWLPTTRQSTADFEELVSTIDAQAFLAQIPQMKGLGALSDAEGKKLSAALQNFSLRQSPERLIENAREAQRLLTKARKNIAQRYGVPETIPDTPAVETPAEDIESLLQRYGGAQ